MNGLASTLALFLFLFALLVAGCGDDAGTSCPPDYPIMRDGFCYRADDGSVTRMDGGSASRDGGGARDGGGVGIDAGEYDAGEVICRGEHPLVMGDRRYCNPGDCYCGDPDSCFPADIASACCTAPVVCDGSDAGPGVICRSEHPLVMGDRRYCNPGDCYCADPDACFPMEVADACCPGAVVCE